jgi:hypothetical protein
MYTLQIVHNFDDALYPSVETKAIELIGMTSASGAGMGVCDYEWEFDTKQECVAAVEKIRPLIAEYANQLEVSTTNEDDLDEESLI